MRLIQGLIDNSLTGRRLWLVYFSYLLLPGAPFVIGCFVFRSGLMPNCTLITFDPYFLPITGLIGRSVFSYYLGGLAFTATVLVVFAVSCYFFYVILKTKEIFKAKPFSLAMWQFLVWYGLVWSVGLGILVFLYPQVFGFCVLDKVGDLFLSPHLLAGSMPRVTLHLFRIAGYLNIFITIWFVVAMAVNLASAAGNQIEALAAQVNRLKNITYAGSLALTAGLIATTGLLKIGESFIPLGDPLLSDYRSLTSGHQIFWGGIWSLVLLSALVPVAIFFNARAQKLAHDHFKENSNQTSTQTPPLKPNTSKLQAEKRWLKIHGLTVDLSGQLRQILAALGPIFAALASEFSSVFAHASGLF